MAEPEPTSVALAALDEGAYSDTYSDSYVADTYAASDGNRRSQTDVTSGPSTSVEVQH